MRFANGTLTPANYFPPLIAGIKRDLANAKAFNKLGNKKDAGRCFKRYKLAKAELENLKKKYKV